MKRPALSFLFLVVPLNIMTAQCCPGDIHGRVTNNHGSFVAGAAISVHDCAGDPHTTRKTLSDSTGRFEIEHMAWGPCVVTVTASGYERYEQTDIRGTIDHNLELNVILTRK